MKKQLKTPLAAAVALALMGAAGVAGAKAIIQCPGDTGGPFGEKDGIIDAPDPQHPNAKCTHLVAGEGFITMADGREQFIFSFTDVTGIPESKVIEAGALAASFSASQIVLEQDQEFYLTLTNAGFHQRPDLFDPHTVHFHGFPNASLVFDGVPEGSISINEGASLTYYYKVNQPGTFMYHCHVEATEHMQMGMLGNLYVHAAQDNVTVGTNLGGHIHAAGDRYVYNDGDGSTRYDVEAPLQLGSFDPVFHDSSRDTQPLPFAEMKDTYTMLNGRGYPESADPATDTFRHTTLPDPWVANEAVYGLNPTKSAVPEYANAPASFKTSQPETAAIEVASGDTLLLRISNLNVTNGYTVTALGLPMKVVGNGAEQARGPGGEDISYETNSVNVYPGEAYDVLVDTTGIPAGTYFFYTNNLHHLSNGAEDFGGMMTEITIL